MRLDQFLTVNGFYKSRSKALNAIKDNLIKVDGVIENKPSREITTQKIEIVDSLTFVSLGGYKLEKALSEFDVDIQNLVFADIGASTGGFTDCLLKRGVKKVFAVDVGCNQLDESLKNDKRVVVMDGINARNLTINDFADKLDGIVVDCSFISLKLILPILIKLGAKYIFTLIKPQFEVGKNGLGKSGIVTNKMNRYLAVKSIIDFGVADYKPIKITSTDIKEKKNIEYIVMYSKDGYKISDEYVKNITI